MNKPRLKRLLAVLGVQVVRDCIKFSDLDKVVEALDKSESTKLAALIKSKPKVEWQDVLEDYIFENALQKDDINDLMYDLERLGIHNLKKPVAPPAPENPPLIEISEDTGVEYADSGRWRSYDLYTTGRSYEELFDNASISETDQDGGEIKTYDLQDADQEVQEAAFKIINDYLRLHPKLKEAFNDAMDVNAACAYAAVDKSAVYYHYGADVPSTSLKPLTFFTLDKDGAKSYSYNDDVGKTMHAVHLTVNNPANDEQVKEVGIELGCEAEGFDDPEDALGFEFLSPALCDRAHEVMAALKKAGYDGAEFSNDFTADGAVLKSVTVFSSKQITPAKRKAEALDKSVSIDLISNLKGLTPKEQQKVLEDFANDMGIQGDDLNDLMYDLHSAGHKMLSKPKVTRKPKAPTVKGTTCEDFIGAMLTAKRLDKLFMKFDDDIDGESDNHFDVEAAIKCVKDLAKEDGVTLSDIDTADVEDLMRDAYIIFGGSWGHKPQHPNWP